MSSDGRAHEVERWLTSQALHMLGELHGEIADRDPETCMGKEVGIRQSVAHRHSGSLSALAAKATGPPANGVITKEGSAPVR
jgi:hypothetical protein